MADTKVTIEPLTIPLIASDGEDRPRLKIRLAGFVLFIAIISFSLIGRTSLLSSSVYSLTSVPPEGQRLLFILLITIGIWAFFINPRLRDRRRPVNQIGGNIRTNVLTLDSTGLTCPPELLDDRNKNAVVILHETSLKINWDQIESWTAYPYSSLFVLRGAEPSGHYYLLGLKKGFAAPRGDRTIAIKRGMLQDAEQEVLSYAQRFLPFDVEPTRVSMEALKPLLFICGIVLVTLMYVIIRNKSL
jgi:hypothetical protein